MNKITELMDRLERVKSMQTDDTPDALSVSLWELGAELSALDEAGVAAAAVELGISPEAVVEMARSYSR